MTHRSLVAATLIMLCLATACSRADDGPRLYIFAASSLTEPFTAAAAQFENEQPDVQVSLSFAGSQALRLQVEYGARADVVATANRAHLDALITARHVRDARSIAANTLAIVVPLSNPAAIASLADLRRPCKLVIGTAAVPIGRYTRQLLARANTVVGAGFADAVRANVVSEESNVRLARARVALGEADAAIVYATDAEMSPRVRAVDIAASENVVAHYEQAISTSSNQPKFAALWQQFIVSGSGQQTLREHGFLPATTDRAR